MRSQVALIALVGILTSAAAEAARPRKVDSPKVTPPCEAVEWPFARKQSKEDYYKLFRLAGRRELQAYYYGELTRAEKKEGDVPYYLSHYLVHTENQRDQKAFYSFLQWSADLQGPESKPTRLPMEKICEYQKKFLATKK